MKLPLRKNLLPCLARLTACGLLIATAHAQQGGTNSYISTGNGQYTQIVLWPTGNNLYINGQVSFLLPLERIGHSFGLKYRSVGGGSNWSLGSLNNTGILTSGAGGAYCEPLWVLVSGPVPSAQGGFTEWCLTDSTTSEDYTHVTPVAPATTVAAPPTYPGSGSPILATNYLNWTRTASGAANRYFLLPSTRDGHALNAGSGIPGQGGTWTTLGSGWRIGTYANGTSGSPVYLNFFTANVLPPTQPFALADRTTDEITGSGNALADVRAASAWSYDPGYNFYATYGATVTFTTADEVGHKFNIHCKIGAAPEMQLPCTAALNTAGKAMLTMSVPVSVPFWVTRDADNFLSPRPVAPASGTLTCTSNNQNFNLAANPFPLPPGRTTTASYKAHTFRINASGPRVGHVFSVRMSDGFSTNFTGAPALITDHVDNWLDNGTPQPLPLYVLSTSIDTNFNTTLIDLTTGETLLTANPSVNTDTFLDGWSAAHGDAPQYPTIALELPASRAGDHLRLLNGATEAGIFDVPAPADPPLTQHFEAITDDLGTMAAYDLPYVAFSLASPLPYLYAFSLGDESATAGDTSPSISAAATPNDLRTWLLPPTNHSLQISSSRWNHALIVRHPNVSTEFPFGESHAIEQHQLAGDTSLTANHHLWNESYYYFEADGDVRSELPWYVEDTNTGERLGPTGMAKGPTNEQLINWFCVPTPPDLSATDDTTGGVVLQWPLDVASRDGSYSLEANTGDGWQIIATPGADQAGASTNQVAFAHLPGSFPPEIQYRVRYLYGNLASDYSPVVTFHWTDTDGDGLPDDWERIWGLDPNNAADANFWLIGDGRTALQLLAAGVSVAGVTNNGASPQFESHTRLHLRWDVADDGFTPALVWDIAPNAAGSVTIEFEDADNHWVTDGTAAASEGEYVPLPRPPRDPQLALEGRGPAVNEPFNYRLRGDYNSNESAVKVRLMMHTARVTRTQPGFREFSADWSSEPPPLERHYYKTQVWQERDHFETVNGQVGSTSYLERDGQITIDTAAGTLDMTDDADSSYTSWGPDGQAFYDYWEASNNLSSKHPWKQGWQAKGDENVDDYTWHWGSLPGALGNWSTESHEGATFVQDQSFTTDNSSFPGLWEKSYIDAGTILGLWWDLDYGYDGTMVTDLGGPDVLLPRIWPVTLGVSTKLPITGGEEGTDPTTILETDGNYTKSVYLFDEYYKADFIADTLARMPAFSNIRSADVTVGGCWTRTEYHPFPTRAETTDQSILDPNLGPIQTSERFLSADCSKLDAMKSEYQLLCNDCDPQPSLTLAEFEENDIPGTQTGDGNPGIVNTVTIIPGATPGRAQQTPTTASNVTGAADNKNRYVSKMPLDIKEVISDQISGNEANKLPTAYYRRQSNNPMLMATRTGNDARLAIKMDVQAAFASSFLVGVRLRGETAIINSVASIAPPGKTLLAFTAIDGYKLYEVVAGYDANGNGTLEPGEVSILFQKTPKTNEDGAPYFPFPGTKGDPTFQYIDRIVVVTQTDYSSARTTTENYGTNPVISRALPNAAKLIQAFATGANTIPEASSTEFGIMLDASIIPSADGLTHPLGAKWDSANHANTHRLVFSTESSLARKVAASTGLIWMCIRVIDKNKNALAASATSAWSNTTLPVDDDNVDFSKSDHGNDVHVAIGKCRCLGSLEISYRLLPGGGFEVNNINCYGSMLDLYDFSYGADKIAYYIDPKNAARTQAGNATLATNPWPDAGRVFFTRVEFGTGWINLNKTFQ